MAFKIDLAANVAGFLKGTKNVEDALDDVADSLDDLARDTKDNADKAADSLEREFSDAFDKVKTESRQASRKMGDDFKDSTRKASDGIEEFGDEANSTAREAAASFDGSAESIADAFQEVAANAFAGFGPAGAAAGLAAAAGIGLVINYLNQVADAAHESQERVASLSDELAEVDGNAALLDWAQRLRDVLNEVVDKKEWFEFWQAGDVTRFDQMNTLMNKYGLTIEEARTVMQGLAGDTTKTAEANELLNRKIDEQNRLYQDSTDINGAQNEAYRQNRDELNNLNTEVTKHGEEMNRAKAITQESKSANDDYAASVEKAKEENERFADSLKSSVSSELGNVSDNLKKGKFDVDGWIKDVENAKKRVKRVGNFTEDVVVKWTPEQQQSFRNMPIEAQDEIAKGWKKFGPKQKRAVREALNDPVTVDPTVNVKPKLNFTTNPKSLLDTAIQQSVNSGGGVVTYPSTVAPPSVPAAPTPQGPVVYKSKVDYSGAKKGAQDAANAAQKVANREGNKIEFKTKVNADGLQAAVNRAAAGIRPPTIYVNVKAKKDVP